MINKHVLVLGVGNILLSDEGVGVHIVHKLENTGLPSEIEIVDGGTGGFELIGFFKNKKKVFIIDCIETDAPAGSMILAMPDELALQWQPSVSVHQKGLQELLAQAKVLYPLLEIFIIGIVPENKCKLSLNLSPTLESTLDDLVNKVSKIVFSKLRLSTGNTTVHQ